MGWDSKKESLQNISYISIKGEGVWNSQKYLFFCGELRVAFSLCLESSAGLSSGSTKHPTSFIHWETTGQFHWYQGFDESCWSTRSGLLTLPHQSYLKSWIHWKRLARVESLNFFLIKKKLNQICATTELRNKQFGCELLTWNQKLWVRNLENWKAENTFTLGVKVFPQN
jgi:hypothetical protein